MPTLREKKACPIALITVREVSWEKSGWKRKVRPSLAPGISSEFTANAAIIRKRMGMRILESFSMPFCTPRPMMAKLIARKIRVQRMGRQPEVSWSKRVWSVAASAALNSPKGAAKRYSSVQLATTV